MAADQGASVGLEEILQLSATEMARLTPAELLAAIQDLFRRWGRFGERLLFQHQGACYAILCDAEAFVVYRLVPPCGRVPSPPGWPVCLVTPDLLSDECPPPPSRSKKDFFSCQLNLRDWLQIITTHFGPESK